MPIFTQPVHEQDLREYNDCHVPAGSPQGGQFCSKGSQLTLPFAEPTARTTNPYFPTTSRGSLVGSTNLQYYESRMTTAQDLADWAADQIATSLGVPAVEVTVADVNPAQDLWGGRNGGYMDPKTPGVLYLTKHTQQNVGEFLTSEPRYRSDAGLVEAVNVVFHELMHVHAPSNLDTADRDKLRAEDTTSAWLTTGLEEGLATYLSGELTRRVLGSDLKNTAYKFEQALVRRMERKAGHNFIRDLYRAPTESARAAMIYKKFPKTKDKLGNVVAYSYHMRDMGLSLPPPKVFEEVLDLFEAKRDAPRDDRAYHVVNQIRSARSRQELEQIQRQLRPKRSQFTSGEQFMLMEQWARRRAEVS